MTGPSGCFDREQDQEWEASRKAKERSALLELDRLGYEDPNNIPRECMDYLIQHPDALAALTKRERAVYRTSSQVAEEPKKSISDETWIIDNEKIEPNKDNFYAVLKKNGDIELRGDSLNGIIESLNPYGIELEDKTRVKRYRMKKPEEETE